MTYHLTPIRMGITGSIMIVKTEHLFTVGSSVIKYNCYGKMYGDFSK